MNKSNTKRLALGGMLGALTIICLLLAAYLPTGRLGFYTLSSFFCGVIIMEYGSGAGWVFYMATGLLAFAVIPDKLGVLPYIFFFGIYAIIKYYIEKIGKLIPEIILKVAFFNLCLGAAYLFMMQVFSYLAETRLPVVVLVIAAEAAFVIYDYVFSLFAAYYRDKLRKHLKI